MNAYRHLFPKPSFLQYLFMAVKAAIMILFYSTITFFTLWIIVEDERYSNLRYFIQGNFKKDRQLQRCLIILNSFSKSNKVALWKHIFNNFLGMLADPLFSDHNFYSVILCLYLSKFKQVRMTKYE